MPRKKTAPPKFTAEQLQEKFTELCEHSEIGACLLVGSVDGRVISMWAGDSETPALCVARDGAELVSKITDWVAKGGMRPGASVH